MKVAVMQPYFLPYIGYFQLIAAVDLFIVYDNIKFTKKGWINRNRYLSNGKDQTFTIPVKQGSDALDVRDREVAPDFDRDKLLNRFREAYRRAPCFTATFPLIEQAVCFAQGNLFDFIRHSIEIVCKHLGVQTELRASSRVQIDHELKKEHKVLALCAAVGATTYVNPIGGTELYSQDDFRRHNIELKFLRSRPFEYAQFGGPFVPWLSIVDVMMFNSLDTIRDDLLPNFDLI